MKLLAAAFVLIAAMIIACSSETTPPPAQPSSGTAPETHLTATTAATEATVATGTPADVLATTAEPTIPPTAIQTSELNILRVTIAEVPSNLPDYERDDWKHWTDADGDCQDARQEVLVAESRTTVSYRTDRQCRVETGQWLAPYTGTVVTDPSKLDVDHMVPLGNAHASSAWRWSAERREQYANYLNDPQHLIAVTASANRSKGARGPEDWKPDDRTYWCQYAVDWVTIKDTWELTVTRREHDSLVQMLNTCETRPTLLADEQSPGGLPPGAMDTPIQPTGTPTVSSYISCDAAQAAGETRVLGSKGGGQGFPKWMVPSARDGDGDGVVCEK